MLYLIRLPYPIKILKKKTLTDSLLLDFSSLYYNIIFHIYNKLYCSSSPEVPVRRNERTISISFSL